MPSRKKWIETTLDEILPISESEKKYYQSLGQVITNYTLVEILLNVAILRISQIDKHIAKALFLPLRVDAATNYLNRLLEIKKLKGWRAEKLKSILQHLGQITRVRNDIVHLGLNSYDFKKDNLLLTNRMWARNRNNLRSTKVSMDKLDQINHDLLEITLHLIYLADITINKTDDKDDFAAWIISDLARTNFGRSRPCAWLYKHEQPVARRRKRHVQPPRQQRQSQSSGG